MKTSVLVTSVLGGIPGYYALSRYPAAQAALFCLLAGTAIVCGFCRVLPPAVDKFFQRGLVPAALAFGLLTGFVNGVSARRPFYSGIPPEKINSIGGVLVDDPRALSRGGLSLVKTAYSWSKQLPGAGNVRASAAGTVPVFFPDSAIPRIKEFGRGGEVFVEGAFAPDRNGTGKTPVFSARSVHVVKPANALEQFRTGTRTSLLKRLNDLDPGGLASALLLGSRENLDGELARSYRDAGLSHVLALSGMHLAFLSGLLALLLKRPLGKKPAAIAGLVFIAVYVCLVGFQPSLLRAALMYAMGAFALLAGIRGITFVFLAAAFFIQTAVDPPSGFSVSFILSYTALAGILLLGEKIAFLMRGHLPQALAGALAASAGAFITTAPFVTAFFGVLRPAGIAAGLAVVPLTALFMAVSLAALVFGGFAPALFGKFLLLLERLIEKPVFAAAGLPGIQAPFVPVLAASLFLAVFIFFAERRYRRYRNYLEPFT